jgi:hypothetical protein
LRQVFAVVSRRFSSIVSQFDLTQLDGEVEKRTTMLREPEQITMFA